MTDRLDKIVTGLRNGYKLDATDRQILAGLLLAGLRETRPTLKLGMSTDMAVELVDKLAEFLG